MTRLELKIPPPLVGALVALGMWALSALGPSLGLLPGLRVVVVALLVLAGLTFDVLGLLAFLGAHTTINPLRPERSSALVTGGIYRVTRNPMYVGMALLLTAWAVHLGGLWAWLGPVAFVLYITRFQIQPEERILDGLFGDEYRAWCARVRRWL
ncbi:methyltransferase family protein [Sphaerotilus mobilis]|uniref:Protein-S-isoprenylcysteine O-methyltransferase Ste14 n=1 Tax=Sphaerotilus mobilis TaxID=47994 RepID=A0A4V2EUW7_9BURK|nr:isoprenylcysteine carboxylmethyltransferase family protein [Sphaerotilus mobilis]RZS46643.1 protein-S-isoprenylcysteine O-methyltransferase Ste14 [Sphaerotilus mobilis]